jgi:hypothetical protein
MPVLLVSANPDLRAVLAFALRYHGLAVRVRDPATLAGARSPTLLLVDYADPGRLTAVLAQLATWSRRCPCLVVCWPADVATIRSHLPDAHIQPFPVQPRALVRQVQALLAGGETGVEGYALRARPLAAGARESQLTRR